MSLLVIEQWDIFMRTFLSLVMIVIKKMDACRTTSIFIISFEREKIDLRVWREPLDQSHKLNHNPGTSL